MLMKVSNGRGQSVNSPFKSHKEACLAFLETAKDDNWIFYWLHKYAMDNASKNGNGQDSSTSRTIAFLGDMFLLAQGMQHLIKTKAATHRLPMIRLHFQGQRFKFYLSKIGTICLKSGKLVVEKYDYEDTASGPKKVAVKWGRDADGDEFYIGCFSRGAYLPCRVNQTRDMNDRWVGGTVREPNATESEMLKRLEENPVKFFTQCSRDMGRCVFCNAALEDQRSKDAGCGQVCSQRFGIPWGGSKWKEKVPSFSEQYDENAGRCCETIRQRLEDEMSWEVFADWLEEHGLLRCKMPKQEVRVPRK